MESNTIPKPKTTFNPTIKKNTTRKSKTLKRLTPLTEEELLIEYECELEIKDIINGENTNINSIYTNNGNENVCFKDMRYSPCSIHFDHNIVDEE